jgi:hypothetical protein
MKLVLLFYNILIINILLVNGFDNIETFSNLLFKANFNENGIILSNHDNFNYINIKYEKVYENNHDNDNIINIKPIKFSTVYSDEMDVYNTITTAMDDNTNFYFEALNTMSYSIHNYERNSLKVSLIVLGYIFQDMNNEFIINLSFNSSVNYDGEYYLEIKDYIVVFSDKVLSDNENKTAIVERFGNYFYLHFPSFKEYMIYDFTIYYNSI